MLELLTWNHQRRLTETGEELMELWVCAVCAAEAVLS